MSVDKNLITTIATLKSINATLHVYSLQSRHDISQKIFKESYDTTSQIIVDLETRLEELKLEEPQYIGNWGV